MKSPLKIVVWSKPACVQCTALIRKLNKEGVEHEVRNLPDFPDQLADFIERGFLQAPITEATGFETFAGNNPVALAPIIAAAKAA